MLLNMNIKKTTFCWLLAFAIALLSFTATLYIIPPPPETTTIATSTQTSLELDFLKRVVFKNGGLEDLFALLERIAGGESRRHRRRHHHQRRRKTTCDNTKWRSRLISEYDVSLVLTVDLKGCANFTSMQKAVDAVPDLSLTRTLIIIDSGTYRSLTSTL